MIDQLDRFVGRISTSLAFLGAGLLGLLAVLIIVDIVGRQIGTPIRGTVEIAAMTVASATFLTIPYAMRQRGHIRSTIVVARLPDGARRTLEAFTYAIGAVTFAILAVSSFDAMTTAFVAGSYEGEGALRVPTFPTRTIIFVSSIVMAVECTLASLAVARRNDDE